MTQFDNIYDVVGLIWGSLEIIALLIACIVYKCIKNQLQKNYIKTLNEHDKAVVMDYITATSKGYTKKEKTKKNEQNKNV